MPRKHRGHTAYRNPTGGSTLTPPPPLTGAPQCRSSPPPVPHPFLHFSVPVAELTEEARCVQHRKRRANSARDVTPQWSRFSVRMTVDPVTGSGHYAMGTALQLPHTDFLSGTGTSCGASPPLQGVCWESRVHGAGWREGCSWSDVKTAGWREGCSWLLFKSSV